MSQLTQCTAIILLMVPLAISITLPSNPVSIPGSPGEVETCPAQEKIDAVVQNITISV